MQPNDFQTPNNPTDANIITALSEPQKKHSKLGIISFVFSISVVVIFLLFLAISKLWPAISDDYDGYFLMFAFCSIRLQPMLLGLASIFGLIALFQKNTRKVFAILGLLFVFAQIIYVIYLATVLV